jgi:predicted dehydrogenase
LQAEFTAIERAKQDLRGSYGDPVHGHVDCCERGTDILDHDRVLLRHEGKVIWQPVPCGLDCLQAPEGHGPMTTPACREPFGPAVGGVNNRAAKPTRPPPLGGEHDDPSAPAGPRLGARHRISHGAAQEEGRLQVGVDLEIPVFLGDGVDITSPAQHGGCSGPLPLTPSSGRALVSCHRDDENYGNAEERLLVGTSRARSFTSLCYNGRSRALLEARPRPPDQGPTSWKEAPATAKLRLGVIGAGSWAIASHLPNFAKRKDDVEFVAVARKGKELLEKVKADWGFKIATEDYRDVVDAGIDICLVASPTSFHYEHARAAMESGAHVLVEKPFTIEPGHAWELVDLSKRLGRHLIVAFGWNYLPMVREAKRIMESPGIGDIEQMMLHMASTTRELLMVKGAYPAASPQFVPEPATWTDPKFCGGGYAQAQLSHALGLALWLTGLSGESAFAFMSAPYSAPVELHDATALRFTNGAIGTMAGGSAHLNAGGNKHQVEMRVIGNDGQFQIDLERETIWLFRAPDRDIRPDLPPNAGAYNCDGPPDTLVNLALGRAADNCSPGWLAARTVDILDACYRSARSGAVAPIPHHE